MWNKFKTLDPLLYLIPLILSIISVVVIYALTVDFAGSGLFLRQGIYAVIGMILMVGVTFVDYRSLKGWSIWLYGLGLIGLALVKLVGKSDFGAQRWIDIGPFQLQPSELIKLILIVALAAFLSKASHFMSGRRFLVSIAMITVPFLAVMLQPDLGTAIVIGATGLGLLLHANTTKAQKLIIWGGIISIVLIFILSFQNITPFSGLLKEYQKDRLVSFVDPSRDLSGTGYNVLQSVIAVGSGGVVGKGLGVGSQSQLHFLPVAHADFIFAGIGEAWGLVGTWGIIGIYTLLLFRILQAAKIAKDSFGMLLCIGILIKILVEVLVNIGMNIRLMPVTGIPLPFLSYGGTTLLTNALALGIVQSVVIRYKRLTF